jgi:hypothetical protein
VLKESSTDRDVTSASFEPHTRLATWSFPVTDNLVCGSWLGNHKYRDCSVWSLVPDWRVMIPPPRRFVTVFTRPHHRRCISYRIYMHFSVALGLAQGPIQWVPGSLSPGIKRPWREADHSPPSVAEIKNAWSYTYTPQYVFMFPRE